MWAAVRTTDPGIRCEGTWHLGQAGYCRLLPKQLLPDLPLCPHRGAKTWLPVHRSGRGALGDLQPWRLEGAGVQGIARWETFRAAVCGLGRL